MVSSKVTDLVLGIVAPRTPNTMLSSLTSRDGMIAREMQ